MDNIGLLIYRVEHPILKVYPLFLAGTKTAFIVFTILCVVGVFASLARGKVR